MSGFELSKRYFELKGKNAEQAITELAHKSFLREWCYQNPLGLDGKEICDLLVYFDNKLLIIQIKDIKFTGNEERYIRKAVEHPIKQVLGAERKLLTLHKEINLTNDTGFTHTFNPSEVSEVYRIVISVGSGEIFFNIVDEVDGKIIHTFDSSIEIVLNELDTISDLCLYLSQKEKLHISDSKPSFVASREVDLLGSYLFNNRSFDHLKGYDAVYFQDGIWEYVIERSQFKAKKEAERVSYFWDHLIDVSHTCEAPEYREIARELSKSNRFERRYLAESFMSAHKKAEVKKHVDFRRVFIFQETVYVFVFSPKESERIQRKNQLNDVCVVAKDNYRDIPNVLGIATEIDPFGSHTYDFIFMDIPEWIEENQKLAEEIRKKHGILMKPEPVEFSMDEYPKVVRENANTKRKSKEIERRKRINAILVPIILVLFGIILLLALIVVFSPDNKEIIDDNSRRNLSLPAENMPTDSIKTPSYTILKKEVKDVVQGHRLDMDILVSGDINEAGLKKLLTDIEHDIKTQYESYYLSEGFNYTINTYVSNEHYIGLGRTIAYLKPDIEPKIWINQQQLNHLTSRNEFKHGLSEDTRLRIFWDIIYAERRVYNETLEDISLFDSLSTGYRSDICDKYGITGGQLNEISIEAMQEDWPMPPLTE